MRRIAREVAGQDVAFVLGSDSPDYDVEVRFFSPRREVTFIGHATIAAHYVRAVANGVPKGKVRQKSGNAIYEVEVTGRGQALRVSIHQGPATFGPVVPEERRTAVYRRTINGEFTEVVTIPAETPVESSVLPGFILDLGGVLAG